MTLDRVFSQEDMDRIRRGVVPETMDDKWFIDWTEDALYFHRSCEHYCSVRTACRGAGPIWNQRDPVESDFQ